MAERLRFSVSGVAEFRRTLDGMKRSIRSRVLRKGVGAGTRVTAKKVKGLVPSRTRLLRRAIGSRIKTYRSGAVVGIVGAREGFRKEVVYEFRGKVIKRIADPVKYLHLVDLGTKPHAQPNLGRLHPGTPATGFMRRGFVAATPAATAAVRTTLAAAIEAEARK